MTRLVVIGSVSLDRVVRLTQPLEVGSHNSGRDGGERIGGGAANSAMAIARATNAEVEVVSVVGEADGGARLRADLADLGVGVTHIKEVPAPSTRSLLLIDEGGERTVVNLSRATFNLPPQLDKLESDAIYVRSGDHALRDYLQARVATQPVIIHTPPVIDNFLPARVVVGSASDLDGHFLADPYQAARRIAGEPLQWVVITCGEQGAFAVGPDRRIERTAPRVEVADTTGAGDAFAAGLSYALATGSEMEQALELALVWGSASVSYQGTCPPPDFPLLIARK